MTSRTQLTERINSLENDFNKLRRDLEVIQSRPASIGHKVDVRLAEITNTPIANDNTFTIMFLDGTFTEVAGNQTPTYTNRQLTSIGTAHNVATTTTTPANGDVIIVWRWSDRWWFDRCG